MSRTYGGIPEIGSYDVDAIDWASFNKVGWQLAPERAGLLVHDMQRFYAATVPTGMNLLEKIVANMQSLISACRAADVPIFYSVARPCANREERGLIMDFHGLGMKNIPEHYEIVDELTPMPEDQIITKKRYSAFFSTDLADRLEAAGVEQLIICGVYAQIGCQMSAMDAVMRDLEVFYVADAMAAYSMNQHLENAEYVSNLCASVQTTKAVVATLSGVYSDTAAG
jgi:isochorismate hydrolase